MTARRRPRRIPRPDSMAEERGGPTAWPTPWPDSVASIVRPDSVASIGNIVRPGSVANIGNIVRPDSVANIGGPAAWPMCDLFRRWPSISMRGKAPVPKSRRRGQDELCLPPLHST